ncbi:MAG: ATP-dependent RecD-like DNA helicase [Clostridia bacterium]|nr:ATP-dependent RecD-like DNA helicase [Clostridia bacterium]
MREIKGTIEDIIFMNPDNGYSVILIDYEGDPLTVVGNFPPVSEGESVELSGEFVTHPKFGKQFKVATVKRAEPQSVDSIIRFLSSGLIKGVGPKTAMNIVNTFGRKTLEVIENTPQKLSQIRGITPAKAQIIQEEYLKNKRIQDAVMFLQNYGITINTALKIYGIYAESTIERVKANPYCLIEDVDGIGFLTADRIASNMGIAKDSPLRIRAGILHVLTDTGERNGNTYLPKEILLEEVYKLILQDEALVANAVDSLILDGKLRTEEVDGATAVFDRKTYRAERGIAKSLMERLALANRVYTDASRDISNYQQIYSIDFNEAQVDAIKCVMENGVSVITGGPGTGKTTVIKCIIYLAERLGLKYSLMAPTGRAAKRITESTGKNASTVHRALGRNDEDGEALEVDLVIVDEVSMMDVYLMNVLLKRIPQHAKVVLVGDKDQLPSVGAGNVLSDILKCGLVPNVKLEFIYRQSGGSLIAENAHMVNMGQMPNLDEKNRDFFFINSTSVEETAKTVLDLVQFRIPKFLDIDPLKIQVLCPMKNGDAGVKNLNNLLQQRLNQNGGGLTVKETLLKKGDKVMHTVNNYSLKWVRYSPYYESGEGVFNGDMGVVEYADAGTGELKVVFDDGREAVYSRVELDELTLAYAVTVHKSQGSEFDAVIIPLAAGSPQIMTRNLLYTAITRAKKMVIIVGSRFNVKRMVENDYIASRYSALKFFMTSAEREFRLLYDSVD